MSGATYWMEVSYPLTLAHNREVLKDLGLEIVAEIPPLEEIEDVLSLKPQIYLWKIHDKDAPEELEGKLVILTFQQEVTARDDDGFPTEFKTHIIGRQARG